MAETTKGTPAPTPAPAGTHVLSAPTAAAPAPVPGAAPERDSRKNLTRAGMEQVIRNGGSVLFAGRTITKVEDLPNPTQLALGDAQAEAAARESVEARIRAAEAELQLLNQRNAPGTASRK